MIECNTCKHWSPDEFDDANWGRCRRLNSQIDPIKDGKVITSVESYDTQSTFGCIKYEENRL